MPNERHTAFAQTPSPLRHTPIIATSTSPIAIIRQGGPVHIPTTSTDLELACQVSQCSGDAGGTAMVLCSSPSRSGPSVVDDGCARRNRGRSVNSSQTLSAQAAADG